MLVVSREISKYSEIFQTLMVGHSKIFFIEE